MATGTIGIQKLPMMKQVGLGVVNISGTQTTVVDKAFTAPDEGYERNIVDIYVEDIGTNYQFYLFLWSVNYTNGTYSLCINRPSGLGNTVATLWARVVDIPL